MSKEITFEELPEDYKFVYKIQGCEHKVDFDTNTIVDKILSTRAKTVDEEVIKQLRNIGEAKGINELILIDESKVLKIIKSLKALEIIKEKRVNIGLFLIGYKDLDYQNYKEHLDLGFQIIKQVSEIPLIKEEYDLLKEVLL